MAACIPPLSLLKTARSLTWTFSTPGLRFRAVGGRGRSSPLVAETDAAPPIGGDAATDGFVPRPAGGIWNLKGSHTQRVTAACTLFVKPGG